jgi:predicted dienelactone hydrolase
MRVVLALSAVLLGALACGAEPEPAAVDPVALYDAPGPYGVGYRSLDVRYVPTGTTAERVLRVLVWYPAAPDPTGDRPLYLLKASEQATIDAPPLELGPRPVLVFSHGHQAYASVMSHFMEHAATHGWIAIAPNHTGNTFADGDGRETPIYWQRAHDVSRSLDALDALPAGDPLSGRLSERRAIVGHSFGGYTAMMLGGARHDVDRLAAECAGGQGPRGYCSTLDAAQETVFRAGLADPRFSALVSLDPGDFDLFGAAGVAAVGLPVLHVVAESSGHRPGDPSTDAYWTALSGADDLRVLLLGGAHNDFMDSCASGVQLRCSTLPPAEVWRLTRVYALAFLNAHLLGDTTGAPILSGAVPVSPLAERTAR